MKSNQTSRGFYAKDCVLGNATSNVVQNAQIKMRWWILNIERNQFEKPKIHSMLMRHFQFNHMNLKYKIDLQLE